MPLANAYTPKIYKCKDTKTKFSSDFFDCIQDKKRLKALKNHYLSLGNTSLPLSYGYVLILSETLKNRFLNRQEKELLKSLIQDAGIDYLSLCYSQTKKRRKYVQTDMFPHLYTFTFPMLDYSVGYKL